MKRLFYGILGWGVFLTLASIGGLVVERAFLLNGLVNPWAVSAVMLVVGLLMILDFILYSRRKNEMFGLTLLTLLANLVYYLCSAIVMAGAGLQTPYATVRFSLGVGLSVVFAWAAWYFCRHKNWSAKLE